MPKTTPKNSKEKMAKHYKQLLQAYEGLKAEFLVLENEEKRLHSDVLNALSKKKIDKVRDYIENNV